MRKIMLSATLLAVAVLLVSAQTGKNRLVEDEIRRLNQEEVEALLSNDVKVLGRLWADDFVVTNPFNSFINKQQVLGMTGSRTLVFTSYERQVEYVRLYGDTAVVAGRETVAWAGKMPTAGQTSQLRFTAIWMKQGKRWQQVARHASMIPGQ